MCEAKNIFLEAVEKYDPEQWRNFLDRACEGDPALREKVEALLQAHAQPKRLLDHTGAAVALVGAPITIIKSCVPTYLQTSSRTSILLWS